MIRISLFIGLCFLLSMVMVSGKLPAQQAIDPPAIYSRIPGWVFEPLKDDPGYILAFGISDPGLPDSIARQQAFLRGVSMGALASGSEGSHLCDFFTREASNRADSKYEEIYRFNGFYTGDLNSIRILADTILKSGEALLLLEIPVTDKDPLIDSLLTIEIVLYNHEIEVSQRRRLMRKYEFSAKLWMNEELYNLDKLSFFRLNRKATGIESAFPLSQLAYDSLEYYYGPSCSPAAGDSLLPPGTLTHQGLWIAYFSQVLDHLSLCVKLASNETARVSDRTGTLTIELNREKEKLFISWRVNRLVRKDQQLHVDLTCDRTVTNH